LRVYLNGDSKDLAESSTLLDLVNELNLPSVRIAIELNRSVVRRREWENTTLNENDRIEIVHFVGGGVGETGVESNANTELR
jgi:thiamine biosynthesis protein ThiS